MSLIEDMADRRYVSRFAIEPVGLEVRVRGEYADADANDVTVAMGSVDGTTVLFERPADHMGTGLYEALLSSEETAAPGLWQVRWTYGINGVPQTFAALLEIGESSPAYDRLDIGFKGIIESVYMRFADLFDSPAGGPHLQAYFQTNFGRGRMAQLLQVAINRLNTVAQPHMTYGLDGPPIGNAFPFAQWGGLLDEALYIECIKHLIRSYVEQPEASGVAIARQDRRDYMSRWQSVLDMETRDFKGQMDVFKIAHMGLGRPHALISGGVYGNYGPTRLPGSVAARPRYWSRMY